MKITICGSIAFYQEMEEIKESLELNGHEVFIPLLSNEAPAEMGGGKKIYFGKYVEDHGGMDAFPIDHELWNLKAKAIRDHYDKIEWCDAIVVVNHEKRGIEGYIGGNTLIEMGVAFFLNKPIYILNPVSSELSYRQEIYGMKPIFLNGDVNIISK
jgi:nucleoside 2-deoxyribosyltransferase